MASRFLLRSDDEQDHIQAQFDLVRAKNAIQDLIDRIESLNAIGVLPDKDCKEIMKAVKSLQEKVAKIGKKKK